MALTRPRHTPADCISLSKCWTTNTQQIKLKSIVLESQAGGITNITQTIDQDSRLARCPEYSPGQERNMWRERCQETECVSFNIYSNSFLTGECQNLIGPGHRKVKQDICDGKHLWLWQLYALPLPDTSMSPTVAWMNTRSGLLIQIKSDHGVTFPLLDLLSLVTMGCVMCDVKIAPPGCSQGRESVRK